MRDPRDVVLSYYDFQRKYMQIDDAYPLEQYVDDFVNGKLISIGWGTWGENVASWIYTRGKRNNFLLMRYEDMMKDTVRELARISEFLDIPADPKRLRHAVESSSADRMRKLEKEQAKQWSATKKTRRDKPFVRKAVSGDWKTRLSESCVASIQAAWGDVMRSVGYDLASTHSALKQ